MVPSSRIYTFTGVVINESPSDGRSTDIWSPKNHPVRSTYSGKTRLLLQDISLVCIEVQDLHPYHSSNQGMKFDHITCNGKCGTRDKGRDFLRFTRNDARTRVFSPLSWWWTCESGYGGTMVGCSAFIRHQRVVTSSDSSSLHISLSNDHHDAFAPIEPVHP